MHACVVVCNCRTAWKTEQRPRRTLSIPVGHEHPYRNPHLGQGRNVCIYVRIYKVHKGEWQSYNDLAAVVWTCVLLGYRTCREEREKDRQRRRERDKEREGDIMHFCGVVGAFSLRVLYHRPPVSSYRVDTGSPFWTRELT